MKQSILTLSFFLFSLFAFAQKIEPLSNQFKKYYHYQYSISNDWKLNQSLIYPKAKFIRETTAGKIYALSQDNMPCLVPDLYKMKLMPNATPVDMLGKMYIPNPYPKQQIIPDNIDLSQYQLRKSINKNSALIDK